MYSRIPIAPLNPDQKRTRPNWLLDSVQRVRHFLAGACLAVAFLSLCSMPLRAADKSVQQLMDDAASAEVRDKWTQAASTYYLALRQLYQLGANPIQEAQIFCRLTKLSLLQHSFSEAEISYKKAMAIAIKINRRTKEFDQLLVCLQDLADTYHKLARSENSTSFYQHTLQIYERFFPQSHRVLALLLFQIGESNYYEGHEDIAIPILSRSIEEFKRDRRPNNPELLAPVVRLINCYMKLERFKEAKELLASARKQASRMQNFAYVTTELLQLRARVEQMEGSLAAAEKHLLEAVNIQRKGSDEAQVAEYMTILAGIYRDQKRFEKSEQAYKKAIPVLRQDKRIAIRPDKVVGAWSGLGSLYLTQRKIEKAEQAYRTAIKLGAAHKLPAKAVIHHAMIGLAKILYETGRKKEAQAVEAEAKAISGPYKFSRSIYWY